MKGTIKTLREGYGFLTVEGEETKDLFFHSSECSQYESFEVGDRVEYSEGIGRRGDTVAVAVEKIEQ